jgi:hypothetical protein
LVSRTGTRTHRILDTLPAGTRISDNFRAPELSPPLADRLGVLFRGASDAIRAAILLAWPLWMLILFFKLTLGFARTWGVPIARLRIEPRSRWIVLTPAVLLLLSVVFQV